MLNSFTFRVISSILIGVLFLQSISCASGYRSLKFRDGERSISESDVAINIYPLILRPSGNDRFHNKTRKKNIAIIGIRLRNDSTHSWAIAPDKIQLRDAKGQEAEALSAGAAAELTKLGENGYVFWGLAWATVNGVFIPFGAIIGISQIAKAKRANKKMITDLRDHSLRAQQLKPGDAAEGLLYYYMRGLTGECKLILTLEEPGTGGQKILEVPVVF
jgi:hypothetical protein